MRSDSTQVAERGAYATKLEGWLAHAPVKVKDIAAKAGMTPEALRNVARGIRGTTYAKAELLSTATGGVVSVQDIMRDCARDRLKARRNAAEAQA